MNAALRSRVARLLRTRRSAESFENHGSSSSNIIKLEWLDSQRSSSSNIFQPEWRRAFSSALSSFSSTVAHDSSLGGFSHRGKSKNDHVISNWRLAYNAVFLNQRFLHSSSANVNDAMDNPLLSISPDRWRGIGLDSSVHFRNFSVDEFRQRLHEALDHWRRSGVRPVTIKIHETDSTYIPVAVDAGFQFHHAQPGYVYLKRWIADEEPDTFPAYANHYLGVAGFVVDRDTDEMLVIKERFAPKPMWKLPGGTADSGEDLHQIACREVKEETGVDTEFVGVVCFRHMHNFRYGCSDFYFVCHLRPLTKEIKIDESEIADCRWMKVDEYLEKQAPTAMNKHFVQCYKDYLNQDKFQGAIGKAAVHHHINKVDYNVYSVFGNG